LKSSDAEKQDRKKYKIFHYHVHFEWLYTQEKQNKQITNTVSNSLVFWFTRRSKRLKRSIKLMVSVTIKHTSVTAPTAKIEIWGSDEKIKMILSFIGLR
jgi:hypothetical protein